MKFYLILERKKNLIGKIYSILNVHNFNHAIYLVFLNSKGINLKKRK
jgi:hypothetical protein